MAASKLTDLLTAARRPRVLVLGDVMLDRYVWGDVDRISPEAPIPVLSVDKREERLGGAGSVVAMLAALDADVVLATVTADDPEGRNLRELLDGLHALGECTLIADDRSTTVKERLLGRTQSRHPQQIIRVDRETARPISQQLAGRLLQSIDRLLDEIDVVLVSDYRKGVCAGRLVADMAALARPRSVPVVADPAAGVDYARYAGCTCLTPNRAEAGAAVGLRIETPADGLEAARRLLDFDVATALVTLDRDGIAWADREGNSRLFPVRPRQVYDITGAGDTVLAALGFALGAGADWPAAIELANLAGGLEVQRLGVTPLSRVELLAELAGDGAALTEKVLSFERLEQQLLKHRAAGRRIVMTNGCFDLLHPGHVAALRFARSQGDLLVVALNSDRSVEALKGAGRPVIDEQGRAETLAAIEAVDYVVLFDQTSVAPLVERLRPDVLVKSAEYAPEEVVGHEIVRAYGGRVVLAPMKPGYGTSELIEKVRSIAQGRTSDE